MTAVHIGVLPEATLEQLNPLHEAALGCITFAAGSELVIEQLRANKKLVSWLALSMCGCSFAIVFLLMITLLTAFPASTGASEDARRAPPTHAPSCRAPRSHPRAPPAPAPALTRLRARLGRVNVVVAMLCAVVAIARSPSSAIAVVTELQADGPFTQTMLGVTMVTDVLVILLFTAAAKLGETTLDPSRTPSLTPSLAPSLTPSLAPSLTPSLAPSEPQA